MTDNGNGLGELTTALAKAQAAFPKVLKDRTAKIASTKGEYSYKYADLASLLDAVRKPLSDNGLALVQPIEITERGMVLHTMLLHSSGAHLDSYYPLATHDRPQEMGSEITYSRRYTAGSILGIASEEDDDGAAAQQATRKPQDSRRFATPPRVTAPVEEIGKPDRPQTAPEDHVAESKALFPLPAKVEERNTLVTEAQRLSRVLKLTPKDREAFKLEYLGGADVFDCDLSALSTMVAELRKREPK